MKLVVLDRDGVINHDSPDFIRSVADWRPIEGSLEAIAALSQAGYILAVATNQSGIGRGLLDRETLDAIHRHMLTAVTNAGGRIEHIAFCPHLPGDGCSCRKPRPGMIDGILSRLGPLSQGWMIGDRLTDLDAGLACGLSPILVQTGRGTETLRLNGALLPHECLIANDLKDAASILIESQRGGMKSLGCQGKGP